MRPSWRRVRPSAVGFLGRDGGDASPGAHPRPLPRRDGAPDWLPAIRRLNDMIPPGTGFARPARLRDRKQLRVAASMRCGARATSRLPPGRLPTCTERLRSELGWGPDVSIVPMLRVRAPGAAHGLPHDLGGLGGRGARRLVRFPEPVRRGRLPRAQDSQRRLPVALRERDSGAIGLGDGRPTPSSRGGGATGRSRDRAFSTRCTISPPTRATARVSGDAWRPSRPRRRAPGMVQGPRTGTLEPAGWRSGRRPARFRGPRSSDGRAASATRLAAAAWWSSRSR